MLCNVMALYMMSCSQKRFIVWKSVMVSTDFTASLHKIRFRLWNHSTWEKALVFGVIASAGTQSSARQHWWGGKKSRNQVANLTRETYKGECIMHRDSLLFPWWPWRPTGEVDDVALFVELASERILVSRRWIDCHSLIHSLPLIAIACSLSELFPCTRRFIRGHGLAMTR